MVSMLRTGRCMETYGVIINVDYYVSMLFTPDVLKRPHHLREVGETPYLHGNSLLGITPKSANLSMPPKFADLSIPI